MIAGSVRAAICSRCKSQTRFIASAIPCPPAESSAQAARRYATFTQSRARCPHVPPKPSQRWISSTSRAWAVKNQGIENGVSKVLDMEDFPRERIRNISIIAHIDHGKSTLADRLLQITGTLPASSSPQFLDKLKVEKERGITVKAQTVSLIHTHTDGRRYLINLIDTPGHVDFSYEVSRSLGACEGALLLVDCTQGIQAQTLSVFHYAQEANLTLLPVINKVDLPHASPRETSEQIASTLGLPADNHVHISAKSGLGVPQVLTSIIDVLPPPPASEEPDGRLRGLVFDTFYDHFRGVVSLVRLFSGSLKKGDKVRFLQAGKKYDVLEVGVHNPEEVPVDVRLDGQVGYVVCNMKNSDEAHIGDTICHADKIVEALPGFKPMKAMVYAGVFPVDSGDFSKLEEAIERLTLNDRSVSIQRESSAALSQGFRLGFLGTLHLDVFRQRLEDEYESNVIITSPTVPFKVVYKNGTEEFISNPSDFPDISDPKARVDHIEEPMVAATIFVPNEYIGEMMTLCAKFRGTQVEYKILEGAGTRAMLRYTLPLSEIVTDFFSELKSASSGFASFDYEEAGYERSDLVKLNMLLNSKPVDALAMVVHRNAAQAIGRQWTKKLRDVLPRQLFELAIQAAIGNKVVARESLSAMRKDVTAGLYGGHYERKMKHLEKQKKGKQRLKRLAGNIDVPQSAFFDVLSSRPRGYSTSAIAGRPYGTTAYTEPASNHFTNFLMSSETQIGMENRPHVDLFSSMRTDHPPSQPTISDGVSAGAAIDGSASSPDRFIPPAEPSSGNAATTSEQSPLTAITNLLPSPSTSDPLPTPPTRPSDPISPHELPPHLRSAQLSHLLTLASSPRATSSEIYTAWTQLYLSSPNTRLFTPPELITILRAMHRADRRHRTRDPHSARQRSSIIREVLDDATTITSPRSTEYYTDLVFLAELRMESLSARLSPAELGKVEKRAMERFPVDNNSIRKYPPDMGVFRKTTDQLLYLAAKAGDGAMFERVERWRERVGCEADGYEVVVRLLALGVKGDIEGMVGEWNQHVGAALPDVPTSAPPPRTHLTRTADDKVALNIVLWRLALMDRWDLIAPAYSHLLSNTHNPELSGTDTSFLIPSSARPSDVLSIPPHHTPSRETYSLLIRATAYQGDLAASLEVMRHMFGDGFSPQVAEYIALFEGFARWGDVHRDQGGELARVFPDFGRFRPGGGEREDGRIGSIWAGSRDGPDMTAGRGGASGGGGGGGAGEKSVWSPEALEYLFKTFMDLAPSDEGRTAPSAKGVWKVLLAFARMEGCESGVVGEVWAGLEGKFGLDGVVEEGKQAGQGEGVRNTEGWEGWKLDKRLKRFEKVSKGST